MTQIHEKNTHKFQIDYFLERLKTYIAEYVEVVCVPNEKCVSNNTS